jgi:tetratricopeptide (TPR) repeat protein
MNDLLEQGVSAFRAGKRDEARKIFITVVKQNPDSERAWGWMYNVANDDKERIYCLKQMLRINPKNEKANEFLDDLTGLKPPLEKPLSPITQKPSPKNAPSQQIRRPEKSVWYRSQLSYLLSFVFITPLWSWLIFTDKKQTSSVKTLAILIGAGYLFFCCLFPFSSMLYSSTTPAPAPTKSLPTPTPLPTVNPEVAKARWGTVDIRALVKNPDNYLGYELHYKGEVFSIAEDNNGAVMQVWVDVPGGSEFDREAVIVYWSGTTENIYEGTTIEFWGYGLGSYEGTNAFGGSISQPVISAEYLTYFY